VAKKRVGHHEALLERVRLGPDITLSELQKWLLKTFGVSSSIGGLWNTFNKLGLSLKKTCYAAEQTRPDVRQARATWQQHQCGLNPAQLIFIDETGTATNRAPRYGRSPRTQRLVAAIAHGHGKTTTFVAGLRHNQLTAPLVINGPMNAAPFGAYLEQILAPTLAPGDIVGMDNLSAHKGASVRQAIQARGATLLYLPLIARTSTRLSNPLQSSRRSCQKRRYAQLTPCGRPLARFLSASLLTNTQMTLTTQVMHVQCENALGYVLN
jgi:hypothetical protein